MFRVDFDWQNGYQFRQERGAVLHPTRAEAERAVARLRAAPIGADLVRVEIVEVAAAPRPARAEGR